MLPLSSYLSHVVVFLSRKSPIPGSFLSWRPIPKVQASEIPFTFKHWLTSQASKNLARLKDLAGLLFPSQWFVIMRQPKQDDELCRYPEQHRSYSHWCSWHRVCLQMQKKKEAATGGSQAYSPCLTASLLHECMHELMHMFALLSLLFCKTEAPDGGLIYLCLSQRGLCLLFLIWHDLVSWTQTWRDRGPWDHASTLP